MKLSFFGSKWGIFGYSNKPTFRVLQIPVSHDNVCKGCGTLVCFKKQPIQAIKVHNRCSQYFTDYRPTYISTHLTGLHVLLYNYNFFTRSITKHLIKKLYLYIIYFKDCTGKTFKKQRFQTLIRNCL